MTDDADVGGLGASTQPEPTVNNEFTIPDEYKDRGWAGNIKNIDDLYKSYDNAQTLIGKKTIGVPNEKSSDEEYEEFYSKVRPESVDGYSFKLENEDEAKFFKDLFHKNGVSDKQAQGLVDGYMKTVNETNAKLFSPEGYKAEVERVLGKDSTARHDEIVNFIKRISPNGSKAFDGLPNNVLGTILEIVDKTMVNYGASEGDMKASTAQVGVKKSDPAGYYAARQQLRGVVTVERVDQLKRQYGMI